MACALPAILSSAMCRRPSFGLLGRLVHHVLIVPFRWCVSEIEKNWMVGFGGIPGVICETCGNLDIESSSPTHAHREL